MKPEWQLDCCEHLFDLKYVIQKWRELIEWWLPPTTVESSFVIGGVTTLAATGHSRAGWNISTSRKRYCRQCATRVSRSAKKCGYCGKRLLSWMRFSLIVFAVVTLLLLFGYFLSFLE